MRSSSIKETFAAVIRDGCKLLFAEMVLAKLEVGDNVSRAVISVKIMALGGVLLLFAILFLTVAGILLLASHIGVTAAFTVIGVACAAVAFLFLAGGKLVLSRIRVLPRRSIARISRSIEQLATDSNYRNSKEENG